ncbi:MAG: nitroreductase [Bacteroidia bacterium]|jgi:nitroreductase|nr:nitroreductase [Bacteroidia bacterium]
MIYSNLEEIIKLRRSVYPVSFSGSPVPKSTIEKMLELANWAPTHLRTEPWRFKVFGKIAMVSLLDQCKSLYVKNISAQKFNNTKLDRFEKHKSLVSHIVAIVVKRSGKVPEFEEMAATAMAVQNMWLYLSNTNRYGGYWSTPQYLMNEDFDNYLNLNKDEKFLGLFYVGELKENFKLPKGNRSNWREKVKFI